MKITLDSIYISDEYTEVYSNQINYGEVISGMGGLLTALKIFFGIVVGFFTDQDSKKEFAKRFMKQKKFDPQTCQCEQRVNKKGCCIFKTG